MTPEPSAKIDTISGNDIWPAAIDAGEGIEATVYCHSYPLRHCRFEVLDSMTLVLSCSLGQPLRHAFMELAFELSIDGEIKRFRQPIHLIGQDGQSALVRFSFEPERPLQQALRQIAEARRDGAWLQLAEVSGQ